MIECKLRLIKKSEWKLQPNVDDKGFSKCIELDGFRNVYIDPQGRVYDLRPKDTKPSYNNFMKYSEKNLYELLIKALNNQISELENSNKKYSFEDKDVLTNIKEELKQAKSNYARLN